MILTHIAENPQFSLGIGYDTKYPVGSIPINDVSVLDIHDSLISAFIVSIQDVSIMVKRNVWVSDDVYPQYDPMSKLPYHVTIGNKIYICISNNNNSTSTQAPSGEGYNNIVTVDGYVWKYVGSVLPSEISSTDEYMKIPDDTLQSQVVNGVCRSNALTTVGDLNLTFTSPPQYKIYGTGNGATFYIPLDDNGHIKFIACTSSGSGYSQNDIVVVSDNFAGSNSTVNLSVYDGEIKLESFTSGSNYPDDSTIMIVGDGVDVETSYSFFGGSLTSFDITSGGTGYTWAKAIVLSSQNSGVGILERMPHNGASTTLKILLRPDMINITKTLKIKDFRGYLYEGLKYNVISILDKYDTNVIGIKNEYVGDVILSRTNIVKDVLAAHKIEYIEESDENDTTKLSINLKLNG